MTNARKHRLSCPKCKVLVHQEEERKELEDWTLDEWEAWLDSRAICEDGYKVACAERTLAKLSHLESTGCLVTLLLLGILAIEVWRFLK